MIIIVIIIIIIIIIIITIILIITIFLVVLSQGGSSPTNCPNYSILLQKIKPISIRISTKGLIKKYVQLKDNKVKNNNNNII